MSRPISEAWFYRMKAATRDLITACGGIERAAGIAHVSKTEAGRWQVTSEAAILPITAALALEQDCGVPYVTRAMADLHGRRLVEPSEEVASAASVLMQASDAARRAGELMAAAATAAADGRLSPAEAETLDRSAGDLARALEPLRHDLAGVRGGMRVVR